MFLLVVGPASELCCKAAPATHTSRSLKAEVRCSVPTLPAHQPPTNAWCAYPPADPLVHDVPVNQPQGCGYPPADPQVLLLPISRPTTVLWLPISRPTTELWLPSSRPHYGLVATHSRPTTGLWLPTADPLQGCGYQQSEGN